MTGALLVMLVLAGLVAVVIARTAVVVPQQSAYVVERLGQATAARSSAGFHILVPFIDVIRYRHSLKETGDRHPGAGLHHARQRAGARRRRALPQGAEPRARLLRRLRLPVRHHASSRRRRCAARSARSTSTAPSRSARTSTSQVVNELDKASEPWGVKVLRYEIKNITPPARRPRRDGEADARRAREARRRSSPRRAQRDAADQHRRGREAAGDQGVRGQAAAADQRGRGRRRRRSSPIATATAEGIRKVAEAIQMPRRLRGGAAARRRAVRQPVRRARQGEQHADPAGQPGRRRRR